MRRGAALLAVLAVAGVAVGAQEGPAPSPILPLDLVWSTDLGGGPSHAPAYAEDAAYVPLRDGTVASIALEDGRILWCVGQPVDWAPAAADDLVVVAYDRRVAALAASDGRAAWRFTADVPVSAPPVWRNGWLVVGLESGDVVALRAADGAELWRRRLGAVLRTRPSIAGQRLYLPLEDGRIVVLELASGDPVWTRSIGGRPREVLALDALFVGSTDNFFYRLGFDDGAIEWRWRTGGDIVGAPRIDAERVYFVAADNVVRALDRRSGVQRWREPLPLRPTDGPALGGPALLGAGGRPRGGGLGPPRGGVQGGGEPLPLRPTDGPALVGPALLVAGVSPEVQLFDPRSGESAGVYNATGELAARPFLMPGLPASGTRLVVLTADGRIAGLAAGNGPPRGSLGFPPPPLLPEPARLALDEVLPVDAVFLAPPRPPPPQQPDALEPVPSGGAPGAATEPADEAGVPVAAVEPHAPPPDEPAPPRD